MSKLSDMEELIETIVDINMKSYMREALTCYMTDAYRACVILCFIAIFEDILKKLDGLAKTNSVARKLLLEVNKKRDAQKVFEDELLNKLKSEKIIAEIDASFLEVLKTLRNKAAHPSGHKPSAEEARFVYSETIKRFLSRPILTTTQTADEILHSLGGSYLFPTTDVEDYSVIVNSNVKNLHRDGYSYLIKKLVLSITENQGIIHNNAHNYILGLCYSPLNSEVIEEVKKQVIVAGAADESNEQLLLECMATNNEIIKGLSEIDYLRIKRMVESTINKTKKTDQHNLLVHPVQFMGGVFALGALNAKKYFNEEINKVLDVYLFSSTISEYASKHEWLREIILGKIYNRSVSDKYSSAATRADGCEANDAHISNILTGVECFELIIRMLWAAEDGGKYAVSARDSNFDGLMHIKQKANSATIHEKEKCTSIVDRIYPGLGELSEIRDSYLS